MKNTLRTMFSSNSQQPEARCHTLLREATFFLDKLKSEEHHLRDMERSACATLAESARVMDSPLPRLVFESGEQRTVETIGGVEFQGQTVERAKVELARKLQTEVFDPLALWVSSYNAALGQQKMIDKLRIERDLQGRKVNKLRGKVEKMHTRNGNKTSHKLEKIIKKLQNHEGQLMVASNRHDEEEEAQYARLRLLIQDAAFMRPYVKRALQQVAMALQEASSALPDGPFTLGTIPETGPPVEAPPITPTADGSALAPLRLKSVGMPVQPMVTTQLSEANAASISNIQVGSAVVDGPQIVSGSATPRAESPRAAIVRANPTYDSPRSQSPYLRSPLGAAAPTVASPVPGTTPGSVKEHMAHSISNGSVENMPSVPATALPSPPNKMTRFVEGESAPSPQVQRVQVQDVPHPMTP